MELFVKIIAGVLIVMLIVWYFPRAKQEMETAPEAQKGDWKGVVIPIIGVVLFVFLLIAMVRQ